MSVHACKDIYMIFPIVNFVCMYIGTYTYKLLLRVSMVCIHAYKYTYISTKCLVCL